MDKKIPNALLYIFIILMSVALASAYPVDFRIHANHPEFHTYVYRCSDFDCNSLSYMTYDHGGYINQYSVYGNGFTTIAEYDFKECYVPHSYKRWMDNSVGNGPWTYSLNFQKMENCMAAIDSMSLSASEVDVGVPVTVTTAARGPFALTQVGPQVIPPALEQHYSGDIDIVMEVRDASQNLIHTETQSYSVLMSNLQQAQFTWTPASEGTYHIYIKTRVPDCACSSYIDQEQFRILDVHGPDQQPVASITAEPAQGYTPLTAALTCTATGGDAPLSYTLLFGDSQSITGTSPISASHIYDPAGTYTAQCVVTDQDGDSHTASQEIIVLEPQVYECSDGIDNDGDGYIDYPQDPGCESLTDDNETDTQSQDPQFVMDDVTTDNSTACAGDLTIQLHDVQDLSGTGIEQARFYMCVGGG
ncbi:PKD domain-containing protein, partial [Candidatus Woesearchaeota archaeon]|nr:PKD domain-containing protein [Candidatus Woesearchaeota archaeon]